MARNIQNSEVLTLTQAQLNAIVSQAIAAAMAKDEVKPSRTSRARKTTPKSDKAIFMKYNPETGKRDIPVECSPAQKKVWEARAEKFANRKVMSAEERAENLAKWQAKREKYTPSKKLKDELKKNPHMSAKEAKEFGFIGTRDDLKALKATLGLR